MKIMELSIEGCLKLSNERETTDFCRVTNTFSKNNYQDLIVSTKKSGEEIIIDPMELTYEYILTDFIKEDVTFKVPDNNVAMIQILNFPHLSDIALTHDDNPGTTQYIDLDETDQLIISNNAKVSMILNLDNDPILLIKSSTQLNFPIKD